MNFILTHKKQSLIFILLIVSLAFLSFYQAFNFSFIIDDWFLLWGVLYDRSTIDPFFQTHPNVVYQFILSAPVFKFNPFYYQFLGFLLKIIDSFFVALLILSITKSKSAAYFSAIIFSSSVGGIETFTWASGRSAALLIPLISSGLFFWINAKKETIHKYFISIILIILTILSDAGNGIVVIPMLILWELLDLQNFSKHKMKKFLFKICSLLAIPLILFWYLSPRIEGRSIYLIKNIFIILANFPQMLIKFLTSIGNLLVGWIIPIVELNHLTDPNIFNTIAGVLFFIWTIILIFAFWKRKSTIFRILLFLSIWIFLGLIPGWLTQSDYIERQSYTAVSHRYLTLSSIGLIGLIAYSTSFIKRKYSFPILTAVIILNLWSSYRILSWESIYHSAVTQNYLYNQIDKDLPKGDEKNKILVFTGDHWVRIALDWNDFYPLALKRGITRKSEFSTVTNDLDRVKELICAPDENTPPKFRLPNLYAWDVGSGDIYNVSKQLRSVISSDKECRFTP